MTPVPEPRPDREVPPRFRVLYFSGACLYLIGACLFATAHQVAPEEDKMVVFYVIAGAMTLCVITIAVAFYKYSVAQTRASDAEKQREHERAMFNLKLTQPVLRQQVLDEIRSRHVMFCPSCGKSMMLTDKAFLPVDPARQDQPSSYVSDTYETSASTTITPHQGYSRG